MGCDIHLHIEIKLNGKWEHYGAPSIDRSYMLFSKMANVRTYEECEEPISNPKGTPKDITSLTAYDLEKWSGDEHSFSWLEGKEIEELEDFCQRRGGQASGWDLEWDILHTFLFGNSFAGFTRYPADRPAGLEGVRFVFWFDN